MGSRKEGSFPPHAFRQVQRWRRSGSRLPSSECPARAFCDVSCKLHAPTACPTAMWLLPHPPLARVCPSSRDRLESSAVNRLRASLMCAIAYASFCCVHLSCARRKHLQRSCNGSAAMEQDQPAAVVDGRCVRVRYVLSSFVLVSVVTERLSSVSLWVTCVMRARELSVRERAHAAGSRQAG